MTQHAADWPENSPSPAQLSELFLQIKNERLDKRALQQVLGPRYLQPFGSVEIPGTRMYVLDDCFNYPDNPGSIQFASLKNFREVFSSQTLRECAESELEYSTLSRSALDLSIITELGGVPEIKDLWQIWKLLDWQSKGESGHLRTDGTRNIFFCRELSKPRGMIGNCYLISVFWDHGWAVIPYQVGLYYSWPRGSRVFHRKFSQII